MANLPPLPEGFTLEGPTGGSGLPPLPTGFSLEPPPTPDIARLPGDVGYANIPGAKPADDPNASASYLTEAGHNIERFAGQVGHGILKAAGYYDDPVEGKSRANLYNKAMADIAPSIPDYTHIHTAHDAALYAIDRLTGISKYALAALGGGVPALATLGGAEGAAQAADSENATPASVATGAGLGAVESALPLPFLKGGGPITGIGDVLKRAAKAGVLGVPYGAAVGATQNIPEAVATGNPADAVPSGTQVLDSALAGGLGGAVLGGAHAAIEGAPAIGRGARNAVGRFLGDTPQVDANTQNDANTRLVGRIEDAADQNGYKLSDVRYNSGNGSKQALDQAHNGLVSEINRFANIVTSDPQTVSSLSPLDLARLDTIFKSARNKLKGRVGEDDLNFLQNTVGHTDEGQYLTDLVRQSNSLTDLYNRGLKGGVSWYTDHLNPFARSGSENSYQSVLSRGLPGAGKLAELAAIYSHPGVAVPLLGGYALGRGIDALTGRRSTVSHFIDQYGGTPKPIDTNSTQYSIIRRGALADATANQQAQQASADQSRIAQREAVLRYQNLQDNDPGVGGFYRSIHDQTGLLPQDAARGVFELNRTGAITPQELNSFFRSPRDLMQGNAGNHIVDMLDRMARHGQLERDPEWYGRSQTTTPDASSNAPQSGLVSAPERLSKPAISVGGRVFTGLNHADALTAVEASGHKVSTNADLETGWTTSNGRFLTEPEARELGKKSSQLGSTARVASSEAVVRNPAAYAAQAAGNQARVTAATDRIARSDHSPDTIQRMNDAIAAVGRTNNRQHASEIRDNLVQSLAPHSPEAARLAHQEIDPLIKQIRHATPEAAEGRSIPRGADLSPLTTDATRSGNNLTRTLAAAYKLKAGIDKPAYEGKREPDKGYLKTVADFHDKAVHAPDDPAVKASYGALARETIAQFKSLGGLKVETWKGEGEPYRNSKEMMRDVADNHHLWFLPTESAFGANGEAISHPMLAPTGLKTTDGYPLLVNDVFRIVHDFYGHTQHGFQFGPVGEYNAYREHAQMYSDAALPALAAETLAQNAWVNFGPHNPQSLPPSQRPFSEQKAYTVPTELLARDPNIGREFVDHLYDAPEGDIKQGLDVSSKKPSLHDLIPGFKGITQFLTPAERDGMITRTAKLLVSKFTNLPSAKEMAAVAYSGRAKKGWYHNSANAIVSVFGQSDAPRFTALLAALSPQTDVQTNLHNAANVWRGWIGADRPKDEASIMRILGEELPGAGTDMDAWVYNSLRALTAEDGATPVISGPKVSSFMANLLGEVNEVTNDTWMANWAGIKQTVFRGAARGDTDEIGNLYGKGSGYLAMSALTRKAASIITKLTGETWTPAEVQETVWSWAKAFSEKANSKQSVTDLVKQQDMSHDEIASLPDFEKLFVSDTYERILSNGKTTTVDNPVPGILNAAGYGDYIDNLKDTVDQRQANAGGNGPGGSPFSAEGSGFGQAALNKYLLASAKRLDTLKSGNASTAPGGADVTGRSVDTPAGGADTPGGGADAAIKPGEIVAARQDDQAGAQKLADALGKTGRPVRVVPDGDRYAVVLGPKPEVNYPTAETPPQLTSYTDPEGRRGAAAFVAGIQDPDGTTRRLSTPQIRAVAKSVARLVEGGIPAPGQNGMYSEGNNTIRVYGGQPEEQHSRVLAHETGHAIEALANVVGIMDRGNPDGDRRPSQAAKALDIVKGLQAVSRVERPHLWEDDAKLEKTFGRSPKIIHEYRNRLDELFADAISFYMRFPAKMKEIAPDAAKFIRDMVNPSKIGKVIAFAGLGAVTLPGIIAQALGMYNQQQDQKDPGA